LQSRQRTVDGPNLFVIFHSFDNSLDAEVFILAKKKRRTQPVHLKLQRRTPWRLWLMAVHHLWSHGNSKIIISMLIREMEIAHEVEEWLHGRLVVTAEVFSDGKQENIFFRKIGPSPP
jgi:hypothetical protein